MEHTGRCNYSKQTKLGIAGSLIVVLAVVIILAVVLTTDFSTEEGCLTGIMDKGHRRVIMVCENSATFIGENHHELWWDPLNKYWFCGMGYRQGMQELNENGVKLPFNLSSTEDRVFYKTELPRQTILPKDEINVRLEYASDSNNSYYANKRDIIIIIAEGRNDPMALAPGGGELKWETYMGHYVDMEVDIRFNITGLN